jgi:ABC-type glycerol-3-phosphate transport system substrate-binding protein
MTPRPSRREALRLIGLGSASLLVAACSGASPPAAPTGQTKPAAAQPADADWQKVVDDANKEGHLLVSTYAGTGYRKIMDAFEAANPGIKVDQTPFQSSSRDFFPRYFQERQAGLFQWDLIIVPATEPLVQAVQPGAIDPIRPLIVRPDVLDDKSWVDGFEGGWLDTGTRTCWIASGRARFWLAICAPKARDSGPARRYGSRPATTTSFGSSGRTRIRC